MQNDSAHERNSSLGSQLGASVSQRISTFPSKNPDCEQKTREGPLPSLCSRTKWQLPIQLNSVERSDALQNVLLWLPGVCLPREWFELLQSFNFAPNQFYRDFLFHSLRVLLIHVVNRTPPTNGNETRAMSS